MAVVRGGRAVQGLRFRAGSRPSAQQKRPRRTGAFQSIRENADQRFENWKLRRALRLPYFLRSTTRASRVRKPAAFSAGRSSGS